MKHVELLWCKDCRKFVEAEGKLDRQGLSNICLECGAIVDVIPYSEVENTVYDNSTKIPSDKVLLKWWDSQPRGIYTCSICGREDINSYVQPQHPGYMKGVEGIALCGDCINEIHKKRDEQRKRDLDAMPRCEVPGCNKRGTWRIGGHTLLCGWHLKNYKEQHNKATAQAGGFGLFVTFDYSKQQILEMAVME